MNRHLIKRAYLGFVDAQLTRDVNVPLTHEQLFFYGASAALIILRGAFTGIAGSPQVGMQALVDLLDEQKEFMRGEAKPKAPDIIVP